jgi:hypothetical protein
MFLPIIFAMILYPVLAVFFVIFVWKRTSRKLLRGLAIAFAILLPSWDAVLSTAIFYIACPYFSKAEIYETAETEGIYYEGDYRDELINLSGVNKVKKMQLIYAGHEDFWKGYQYVESKITTVKEEFGGKRIILSPPRVYRCTPFPENSKKIENYPFWDHQCTPVEDIRSKYVVRLKSLKIFLVKMHFIEIYDRSNGRLMAEYREISKHPYAGALFYPFFTWLHWHGDIFNANEYERCPEESQLFSFQYEVLKVTK